MEKFYLSRLTRLVALLLLPVFLAAETVPSGTTPQETAPTETTPAETKPAEPPTAADTGEAAGTPAPQAMTDSGSGVFLTLTRSAYDRNALPSYADTVTPEEFHSFGALNAGDVLARQTSVQISKQGGLGSTRLAGIRGATSNQTLVLMDGRPIGGVGLSASQDLAEIPLEQIDRIEIVRGGSSALYGANAVGGVINVISKRSGHTGLPSANFGFESRSYKGQAYRLNAGSRVGPLDYYFYGRQDRETGFRDNSDALLSNLGGNAGLSMGKAGKILVDVGSFQSRAGVPGQQFPDIPPSEWDGTAEELASTPAARQDTNSKNLRTSYLLPLPMNSLAAFRLFGSERQVEFRNPDFFVDSDRHEQSKGGEVQFDLPWEFVVGGAFIRDRLDSRDNVTPSNNFIASLENWGIFGQKTFSVERVSLIASGRFDHHSMFGDTGNPRVQAVVDATSVLRFSGSAGRSFRAPTLDDLFYPFTDFGFGFSYQGNPNLKPETAWTYDGGVEVHEGSASLKATYFRANVSNLIQTTADLAATTVNVGTARRQGAEIELRFDLSSQFSNHLNYTYLENLGMPEGFTDLVVLRLSPRHTVNYGNRWNPIKRLAIDNTLRYVGSSYEGNDQTNTKIHDYFLWDLRLGYTIRQLEAFVGMNNVADKRYRERAGYPLPGRTVFGGVSLRLWG